MTTYPHLKIEADSDYLALIDMGYGGGSHYRCDNPVAAITGVVRQAHGDWKHLFRLDGQPVTVALYDVKGHDNVILDGLNAYVDVKGTRRVPLAPVMLVQSRFPGKAKPDGQRAAR